MNKDGTRVKVSTPKARWLGRTELEEEEEEGSAPTSGWKHDGTESSRDWASWKSAGGMLSALLKTPVDIPASQIVEPSCGRREYHTTGARAVSDQEQIADLPVSQAKRHAARLLFRAHFLNYSWTNQHLRFKSKLWK